MASDKSHVGMGFSVCPICYEKHDEVVILDTRLHNSLKRDNFMGFSLCPTHKGMKKEFVGLVEVKNGSQNLTPKDAQPTGQVAMVKRTAAANIFNVTIPDDCPMVYVEIGVIDKLKQMVED